MSDAATYEGVLSPENTSLVEREFPNWAKDFGAGYWTVKPSSLERLLNLARAASPTGGEAVARLVERLQGEMQGVMRGYADRRGELIFECIDALAKSAQAGG